MKTRSLRMWCLAGCASLVAGSVFAGGELPGFYQDPGINPTRATVNHNADEHIDPFTGMLQLHHVDATLSGNGGDLLLEYTPSTNVTLEHIYLNGKRIATKKLP